MKLRPDGLASFLPALRDASLLVLLHRLLKAGQTAGELMSLSSSLSQQTTEDLELPSQVVVLVPLHPTVWWFTVWLPNLYFCICLQATLYINPFSILLVLACVDLTS